MYVVTVRLAVDQETLDEHRTLLTILDKKHGVLGGGREGGREGEREKKRQDREEGNYIQYWCKGGPLYTFKDHRYT